MHNHLFSRLLRSTFALVALVGVTACSMDKTEAPSLAGPSEFGLSITMTATPDVLQRDGSSQSAVNVIARDATGRPMAGQRFALWLTPANGGELSAAEIVTGSDGRGMAVYTAAMASVPVSRVAVNARPVGDSFDNGRTQVMNIGLRGAGEPQLTSFGISNPSPRQFDLVTFDASATTVDEVACRSACTFSWSFGTEATAVGETVSHRFQTPGIHTVTLVITGPGGVTTTKMQTVSVSEGTPPVADFTISPSEPLPGDTVYFNASLSVAKNGARIVEYTWDFGNGQSSSSSSPTTSVEFGDDERTYSVTLTVRDSNGLTHTISKPVAVKLPSEDDDEEEEEP
jgi:hypothetical protein